METYCWIRCVIGVVILYAGVCIRDEHIVLSALLMLIGAFKYLANMKIIIEEEASK